MITKWKREFARKDFLVAADFPSNYKILKRPNRTISSNFKLLTLIEALDLLFENFGQRPSARDSLLEVQSQHWSSNRISGALESLV